MLLKINWNIERSILDILFSILIPITDADITVRGSTDLLLSLSDLGFTGPFDKSKVANS